MKHKFRKIKIRWKCLAAGMVLGAALLAAAGGAYMAYTPTRHAVVSKGDGIKTDLYEIHVGKLKSIEKDPAFTTVPENDVVIIPVTVTNLGNKPVQFFPVLSTYIRDNTGGSFFMHPSLFITNPLPAQNIAPGATLAGELSYQVPKTLKEFKYYVDPGWGDMAPVVFSLKR